MLPTDENATLSALGIVGGDLLHVLQNNITDSSSSSELSSSVPVSQSVTSHGISSKLVNIEEPSTSGIRPSSLKQNNIKSETKESCSIKGNESIDFKTQSADGKGIEHQRAGPSNVITEQKQRKLEYTPKVLLCRDGMPYSLQSSYEIATVVTMHQAVCVAVHVLMLETGFVNNSSEVGCRMYTINPYYYQTISWGCSQSI